MQNDHRFMPFQRVWTDISRSMPDMIIQLKTNFVYTKVELHHKQQLFHTTGYITVLHYKSVLIGI